MSDEAGPVEPPVEPSRAILPPEAAGKLMRAATYASVSVAGTLAAAKLLAWLATDSVSLLSTLVDSALDIGASLVNFFAIRKALAPADRDHRFGHGKAEPLAGLSESAFVLGSGLFVLVQAIQRLIHPRALENTELGYGVMILAMAASLGLVLFQKYVVRKTGSVAIGAESLNYQNDILVNGAVILSLFLSSQLDWTLADPLFAIAIAFYIAWGAFRIGRESLDILMDHELPDGERRRIREVVLACEGVRGVHDLRTRTAGPQTFMQMHLEMDDDLPLHEAHDIVVAVEEALKAAFPNAEVLIHADPESVEEDHPVFR